MVPFFEEPSIFPDETCVLLRARYFADTFSIQQCTEIMNLPAGDPRPLYSILLAPLFKFTYGLHAFHWALALNALMTASLVFPLFNIFKRFVKNNTQIFFSIILLLFLPQIVIFEKMVMTELFFVFLAIWGLFFYMKSFSGTRKVTNKITAITFSILAAFTRPFGFMIPLSILINEIILTKSKKLKIALITSLLILSAGTVALYPLILDQINSKWLPLFENPQYWKDVLIAIKGQLNSFSIATFLLPITIFFAYIGKKDSKDLKNIKWFLISLITINFLISAQHIFGYLIKLSAPDPVLLTRYINLSLILIYLFAIIFFLRYKKVKLNQTSLIITATLIFALLFFQDETIKDTLNLDLAVYFDNTKRILSNDLIKSRNLISTILLPIMLLIFTLFALGKRKIVAILGSALIIIYSVSSMIVAINTGTSHYFETRFADTEYNITFLLDDLDPYLHYQYGLFGSTKNNIESRYITLDQSQGPLSKEDLENFYIDQEALKEYENYATIDYYISSFKMDLPIEYVIETGDITLYLYKNILKPNEVN